MKQVSQRPRTGIVSVVEVPEPVVPRGWVLVRNEASLISAGTERSKIELGRKSLLAKARARPDLARKVVDRARVEGVRRAIDVARDRLDALAPVGYSSAGVVCAVGAGVEGIAPGDRVSCGGGGWANHAEIVSVPKNLIAPIPAEVASEDAAYATVGAIALHGLRQAGVSVGDVVGVVGLGLVGQLALRLGRAAGCTVIGVDPSETARAHADRAGVSAYAPDDTALQEATREATAGRGLDAILVCAASSTTAPVELATRLARDRAVIVIVGDVPVAAERASVYDKELELRIARSYGPGRYDREYEEGGLDLPAGYVRWTEGRNMHAVLDLIASGALVVSDLTTHRFSVDKAADAYEALLQTDGERPLGVVLVYPDAASEVPVSRPGRSSAPRPSTAARIGVIGAGSFARSTLIPALDAAGASLVAVASSGGLTARDTASRLGFERAATLEEIVADESIDGVVIATRHASHASLVEAALAAGKAVFVEKPLALDADGLARIEHVLTPDSVLMVGFNRRYAPLVRALEAAMSGAGDRLLHVRVNAGVLPASHWLHDPHDGGGRLLGEACHFIDLILHLAASPVVAAEIVAAPQPERPIDCSDSLASVLRFADGTVGNLVYTGAGDTSLPKERIEVFGGGMAAVIDDYRRLDVYRGGRRRTTKARQDKGHRAELAAFVDAVAGRAAPPDVSSYLESTRVTFRLAAHLRQETV